MENLSADRLKIYQELGIDGLVSPEDIAAQEIITLPSKQLLLKYLIFQMASFNFL